MIGLMYVLSVVVTAGVGVVTGVYVCDDDGRGNGGELGVVVSNRMFLSFLKGTAVVPNSWRKRVWSKGVGVVVSPKMDVLGVGGLSEKRDDDY